MDKLIQLRDAESLKDLARILRVQPRTISFLIYKLPANLRYYTFEIPKRSGGMRTINAPEPRLKMLQRRLADCLYSCTKEIYGDPPKKLLSHGFLRSRSIFTNASLHRNRRYVLNLDLEDFFPSFNFGRVRGFFLKDNRFGLHQKVATMIAQIACHQNELPQGSPCSPIITNLIGHMLDVRLVKLARKNNCSYSRYADDITFSTNIENFPAELAEPIPGELSQWCLGEKLTKEISNSGFEINKSKTRMQWQASRQTTTGLTVNKKVNVRLEYYRKARAICHQLFSTGSFYINDSGNPSQSLNQVDGILSHIHQIKQLSAKAFERSTQRSWNDKVTGLHAIRKLYRLFLIYKYFNVSDRPIVLTEGETDPVYLKLAIKKLKEHQPKLGEFIDGKFHNNLKFLKHSGNTGDVLQLDGGVSKLNFLIKNYRKDLNRFKYTQLTHPVITLIDNDKGAKDVFNTVKNHYGLEISHDTEEPFYHLAANLYLVKTPLTNSQSMSRIEDMFDQDTLNTTLDGRRFDPDKKNSSEETYGKTTFAREVVIPNADEINFEGFERLLSRISAVLDDYTMPRQP